MILFIIQFASRGVQVFFPVCDKKHSFIFWFDLKEKRLDIMDNIHITASYKTTYDETHLLVVCSNVY